MQTLQDVIDAVAVIPEQYGHSEWKDCPLTTMVMADSPVRNVYEAARRLNCSSRHTTSFVVWWDGMCARALTFPYDIYDLSNTEAIVCLDKRKCLSFRFGD